MLTLNTYFVTFGVQYTGNPDTGEVHPLGVTKNNYVTIEAPDMEIARGIAHAIFARGYAFLYDEANFMFDGTFERWYSHEGAHAFAIKWVAQ